MNNLSRRRFGKELSVGALGALAAGSNSSPAEGQAGSNKSPKRMTTALREMIDSPGVFAAPGIYDPITARIAELLGEAYPFRSSNHYMLWSGSAATSRA